VVKDPRAAAHEALHEDGVELRPPEDLVEPDGLVLIDVESVLASASIAKRVRAWSL
jgi:hypothetical protein